jgi:hypothetical protein
MAVEFGVLLPTREAIMSASWGASSSGKGCYVKRAFVPPILRGASAEEHVLHDAAAA